MAERDSDSSDTSRLLERARLGDLGAFERLVERHRPALRRAVERRLDPKLLPRVDASDVVQEAQLEAFNRLDSYLDRRPMPFRLWLLKTAHEHLLKLVRRHLDTAKRTVLLEVPLPDRSSFLLAQQLVAGGPTPSDEAHRHELARRVRTGLAQLSETDRDIVLLRNFDGLSNSEVSQLLDVQPEAAKKRYARALLRLKKALTDGGLRESQL
jgi:RNA polymerase sigma-70 factor (ECF subfamily)